MLELLSAAGTYLEELNGVSILFRLALAMGLGGILGIERGKKGRPAGFRTYISVCVASSLATLTGQYIFTRFQTGDPARLGAQVISGIGFLGAGTILITKKTQVRGLTTAAGLWAAACIGLAVGIGFYWGAILCTALIFLGMTLMQRLERRVAETARDMTFFAEFETGKSLSQFIHMLRQKGFSISDIQMEKRDYHKGKTVSAVFNICKNHPFSHSQIIEAFSEFEGINFIERIQ